MNNKILEDAVNKAISSLESGQICNTESEALVDIANSIRGVGWALLALAISYDENASKT